MCIARFARGGEDRAGCLIGRSRSLFLQIAHEAEDEAEYRQSGLGCGLLGHVPAGKDQDGWMALEDPRQSFGAFDAKIDGVVFNGRDRGLWNLGPSSQLALRESL